MLGDKTVEELAEISPIDSERPDAAAVGGTVMPEKDLAEIRAQIVDLAREYGYPSDAAAKGDFDTRCALLVRERFDLTLHEAANDDGWGFISSAWMPDVVRWRFGPDAAETRFLGDPNRNFLRRLWWRNEILGEQNLRLLGEDEIVQLMERPTLTSDARVSRAIVTAFLESLEAGGVTEGMRMDLMRDATKRILRLTAFVDFGALNQDALDELVSSLFLESAHALSPDGANVSRAVESTEAVGSGPASAVQGSSASSDHKSLPAADPGVHSSKNVANITEEQQRVLDLFLTNRRKSEIASQLNIEVAAVRKSIADVAELLDCPPKRGPLRAALAAS
jgi:DNA-binding NarL/FixJ family response regulator